MASIASSKRGEDAPGSYKASVRELAVHAARIQLASITASSRFVAGWIQSADRYAEAVSNELLARVHGEVGSSELIGRLADATSAHLHDLTALPSLAADHFAGRVSKPGPRGRIARR